MAYEVTIGIEIHTELKTKTKMFSASRVSFDDAPNTHVNEVDLALPGTLPTVNKKAVEFALRLASALNMEIDTLVKFDRKNYFYSDLPKGYQITQHFFPIGQKGELSVVVDDQIKTIGITRIHMEEDTAKQIHTDQGTLIDFNRAGVPLLEIVSEPDMHSAKEAAAYVKALRELIVYLGISDGKMEEGSLRCDVNISIAKSKEPLGTKVEIKNLNSINNVQKAIECEIERQTNALDNGEAIVQSTRRFDESKQDTVLMRKKEGAVDYRYFPEPNILPIQLDDQWVKQVIENSPETPMARYELLTSTYKLEPVNAQIMVSNKDLGDYFKAVITDKLDPVATSNYLISEASAIASKENKSLSELFDVNEMRELLSLIQDKTLSSKQAKMVIAELALGKKTKQVIEEKGLKQVSDPTEIQGWIDGILEANPQVIEDYRQGKDKSVKFVMGQVMKVSKGQANPALANKMVLESLLKKIEN